MNPKLDALIDAAGWTFVHVLWQGLLIAIIVGLLLVILRQKSPCWRYGVLVSGMLLMPLVAVATFLSCWQPAELVMANTSRAHGVGQVVHTGETFQLEHFFPYLVAIWAMGSLLLGLRSLLGYFLAQRLLKHDAVACDPIWQKRLNKLVAQLDIRRPVRMLLSQRVDVPMVIGHAKPVILLPISVLTGLPLAEVEAILLHELAHVRRNDYLLNLFQTGLEAVFFFHPACWWMSSRLRAERELCCDDLAIAVTLDPLTFAKALTHLEEVHMKIPHVAMAARGRGALFSRIERLWRPTSQTGPREALSTLALVLAGALVFVHFTGLALAKPGEDADKPDLAFLKPVIPADGHGNIVIEDNGQKLEMRFDKGSLTALKVQGETRPLADVAQYRPMLKKLVQNKLEADLAHREKFAEQQAALEAQRLSMVAEQQVLKLAQEQELIAVKAAERSNEASARVQEQMRETEAHQARIMARLEQAREDQLRLEAEAQAHDLTWQEHLREAEALQARQMAHLDQARDAAEHQARELARESSEKMARASAETEELKALSRRQALLAAQDKEQKYAGKEKTEQARAEELARLQQAVDELNAQNRELRRQLREIQRSATQAAPAPRITHEPAPAPRSLAVPKPAVAPRGTSMSAPVAPSIKTAPAIAPVTPMPRPVGRAARAELPEHPEIAEREAFEAPEAPEAPERAELPEAPEAPEAAEMPEAPEAAEMSEAPESPEPVIAEIPNRAQPPRN